MSPVRMAQVGTKHGHAAGKLLSMQRNPHVEFAGVFEPDEQRRGELSNAPGPYQNVHWFHALDDMLSDRGIVAVASEGSNRESLAQTEAIVQAGKHVWYDKPAGLDWEHWQRVAALSRSRSVVIQMGYMFRYHHAFRLVSELAREGALGAVFSIRAHMSTWLTFSQREVISAYPGGIFFDLAAHMLDQILWVLGRPRAVTAFLRNDGGAPLAFQDNTLGVFEFEKAIAFVDIAAMEPRPMARRYEVYGRCGSAIISEPFESTRQVRLALEEPAGGYSAGEHLISVPEQSRQDLYDRELEAFLATILGRQPADRPLEHDSLVQETLLRSVGLL